MICRVIYDGFIQVVDDGVDVRLQMLSDVTVECNELDKTDADRIQQTIAELKVGLIELRKRLADRARSLQQQKATVEKQKDDFQQSSSDLQQWFEDTRKIVVQQVDVLADDSLDNQVCHQRVSSLYVNSERRHRH